MANKFIPERVVEEVLDRVDLVSLISDYVRLKKRGRNYVGLCPFHSEKTPSFSISPENNLFYCFGCGVGGDAITFLRKIENLTFQEAVETLANREGIHLSITNTNKRSLKNEELYKIHELAQKFYSYLLFNHESASATRQYLQKRGIDKETAVHFGLGYAPNSWRALYGILLKRGIDEKLIKDSGLISVSAKGNKFDRFRDRLIFPIFDWRGKIVGFGGRNITDTNKSPKYLNSPETKIFNKSHLLYGLNWAKNEIRKQNQAIIVEGYMDVIACQQFGFTNTVASLGTSFTKEQAKLLKRYCTEVIIAYDSDLAGTNATLRGLEILRDVGLNVKILRLPQGSDPDDFLRNHGKDAFLNFLQEKTLNLIDYKLIIASHKYNITTLEGKRESLNFIINDLSRLNNAVERQYFVEKVSQKLQIPENAILEEIAKAKKLYKNGIIRDKKENIRDNTKENILSQTKLSFSEKYLLKKMLEEPSIFDKVEKEVGLRYFGNQIYELLNIIKKEKEKLGDSYSIAKVLSKLDENMISFVSNIIAIEPKIPVNIEECIKNIKLKYIKRQQSEILQELHDAEQKKDTTAVVTLIKQLESLQREIQNLK